MLHCFTCTDSPFTLCFVKPCSHEAIKYTQEMPFFPYHFATYKLFYSDLCLRHGFVC